MLVAWAPRGPSAAAHGDERFVSVSVWPSTSSTPGGLQAFGGRTARGHRRVARRVDSHRVRLRRRSCDPTRWPGCRSGPTRERFDLRARAASEFVNEPSGETAPVRDDAAAPAGRRIRPVGASRAADAAGLRPGPRRFVARPRLRAEHARRAGGQARAPVPADPGASQPVVPLAVPAQGHHRGRIDGVARQRRRRASASRPAGASIAPGWTGPTTSSGYRRRPASP